MIYDSRLWEALWELSPEVKSDKRAGRARIKRLGTAVQRSLGVIRCHVVASWKQFERGGPSLVPRLLSTRPSRASRLRQLCRMFNSLSLEVFDDALRAMAFGEDGLRQFFLTPGVRAAVTASLRFLPCAPHPDADHPACEGVSPAAFWAALGGGPLSWRRKLRKWSFLFELASLAPSRFVRSLWLRIHVHAAHSKTPGQLLPPKSARDRVTKALLDFDRMIHVHFHLPAASRRDAHVEDFWTFELEDFLPDDICLELREYFSAGHPGDPWPRIRAFLFPP